MTQPFDLVSEYSPENEQRLEEYLQSQIELFNLDAIMVVGVRGNKTNVLAGSRKPRGKLLIKLLSNAVLKTIHAVGGTTLEHAETEIRIETKHNPRL